MTKPADPKSLDNAVEIGGPCPPPADPLTKLREPFPPHHISKLPKETKKQKEEREADRNKGVSCQICGSWHHKNAVHLDYVGHAALTDRLLDTDPLWSWEPAAWTPEGIPRFDPTGGLWIKLTICGVTRLGYGHAAAKPHMDPGAREKEVIGDALRNAAMRFGAALDLWHKGDLHPEAPEPDAAREEPKAEAEELVDGFPPKVAAAMSAATVGIDMCGDEAVLDKWLKEHAPNLGKLKAASVQAYEKVMQRAQERKHELREAAAERVRKSSDAFDISDDEIPF